MYTLGIDIGGTFTDFTLVDDSRGTITLDKELTTPDNPAIGALEGSRRLLAEHDVDFADVETVIHGTTLVSNTIIERTGARTGLLTTSGARDILELRRGWRYDIYDWQLDYPEPLAPRDRVYELDERITADGEVVDPLNPADVRETVETLLADHGVESIAVSLLHAYESDDHERIVADVLADYSEIHVSLSSQVAPVIREYERTSTTVLNAYVAPVFDEYLEFLRSKLRSEGFEGAVYLMTSSGGIVGPDTAVAEPVRLVESGPAAGVLANRTFAESLDVGDIFSFDMGGTTAKGSIVRDGEIQMTYHTDIAREHRFKPGSGYDVVIPMIDITEIGAGGGSVASVEETTGLVEVGPESAGSDPGPVCYGRGGDRPTVTDAALLLGYLDADRFMGGRMELVVEEAESVFVDALADPLGLSPTEAAWQVFEIVSENMANAFRQHTTSQGIDPRGISMVAIGGAGPMTAFNVARKVGIEEIICPFGAGVGSSIGLIEAPKLYESSSTRRSVLADLDAETMIEELTALYANAEDVLVRAGADAADLETAISLDMRHINQGHEIEVPLPDASIETVTPAYAHEQFQRTYRRLFNRDVLDLPVEVINYRVEAHEPTESLGASRSIESPTETTGTTTRTAFFGDTGSVEANVYRWPALTPGETFAGPAIVEADQATVVVDPNSTVAVTDDTDLRIALEGGA